MLSGLIELALCAIYLWQGKMTKLTSHYTVRELLLVWPVLYKGKAWKWEYNNLNMLLAVFSLYFASLRMAALTYAVLWWCLIFWDTKGANNIIILL